MGLEFFEKINIDEPSNKTYDLVKAHWDTVAKPLDSLGYFEDAVCRIGAIKGTDRIDVSRKAVIAMCADNGIVAEGVTQSGQEVTAIVAACMGRKESSVCRMANRAGIEVIPVDIGINSDDSYPGVLDRKVAKGTRNFSKEPAMTEEETLKAIECGINLVKEYSRDYDMLALGEMGIGNTTTSSALTAAILGCDVASVTGRGAGLSDDGVRHKITVIENAIKNIKDRYGAVPDTFALLQNVGGLDIAGLAGVCIGGAIYKIPIVLDGVISCVAGLVAEKLVPGVKDYLIASHSGKEKATENILRELGLKPVIYGNMALGEGTGAVMMMSLIDLAMELYNSSTTFEQIQMDNYKRL